MGEEKKQVGLVKSLMRFTGTCRGKMVFSVVFAVLGVCAGLLPYIGATYIVEGLFDGTKDVMYYVIWAVAVGGGGAVIKVLLMLASTALSHISAFRILEELRLKIAVKLNRVSMGYLTDTPSGKIKKIAIDDTEKLETPIAHMIPEVLGNIMGALAAVIYLFVIDWRMALVSLISLPIGLMFYMGMMRGYKEKWGRYTKAANEMNSTVIEYVSGIEVIKTFGRSGVSYKKYTDAVMENNAATTEWQKSSRWWLAGVFSVWPAVLLFVLPIGLTLVFGQVITGSTLISCAIISLSVVGPLMGAISYMDQFAEASTVIRSVNALLDEPEMHRPDKYAQLYGDKIELKSVSFSYAQKEILHAIDLSIEKGAVTALVGPSGGGKSTIAKLIAGYWDVNGGAVDFFGADIKNIPFKQLNEHISYVAQDNFLFDMSILENIRMGDPDAGEDKVYAAAKAANCHDFILNLPQGYDTKAGDAGDKLSGGERQRITIARAILKDAPVVILDEATAYADPENEAEIQNAILKLTKDKTLLIVAHRLGTVKNASKIAVIENGSIAGQGTHGYLLKSCKTYQTMWDAYQMTEKEESNA